MVTRRDFLRQISIATAGLTMGSTPDIVLAAGRNVTNATSRSVAAKIKIAYIGIGNRGEQNIEEFEKTGRVEVIALCDVDFDGKQCEKVRKMYPKAKLFRDFRKMFDEIGNEFEAVMIATPDHNHFAPAMLALNQGKHVYVEKPLSCTFLENQLLIDAANKHPELATQMGNQGHSEANYFQFKAWKEAGLIKDVTKVNAHMNNIRRWHKWSADIHRFPREEALPAGMDWDTWLGPRHWHDYNHDYHQGQWRCWYDFGMGCLGDWAAHIIDTIHEFCELGLPYEVTLKKVEGWNQFFYPFSSTILFRFPARNGNPPVDITWYDGLGNYPELPKDYGASIENHNVPVTNYTETTQVTLNPGKEIYQADGTIFKGGTHAATLEIIGDRGKELADVVAKIEVPQSPSNHYENFLNACLGIEKTRSPFQIVGPLCQAFSLGVIAQRLNAQLFFDERNKMITNNPFANALLVGPEPRRGWEQFYKM